MIERDEKDSLAKTYREVAPYLGLGVQLAATIVLMVFLGSWVGEQLGNKSLWTLIFAFFGGAAGIYNFIKTVIKIGEKKKDA